MRTLLVLGAMLALAACAVPRPHPAPTTPAQATGCGPYLPPVLTYDEFRQQYHSGAVAGGFRVGLLSGLMAMNNDEYPAAYAAYLEQNKTLLQLHAEQQECLRKKPASGQ